MVQQMVQPSTRRDFIKMLSMGSLLTIPGVGFLARPEPGLTPEQLAQQLKLLTLRLAEVRATDEELKLWLSLVDQVSPEQAWQSARHLINGYLDETPRGKLHREYSARISRMAKEREGIASGGRQSLVINKVLSYFNSLGREALAVLHPRIYT